MTTFWAISVALAAPEFVAADPADVEVAQSAWAAATQCTGWEPKAHPKITIERGHIRKGFLGLASSDKKGLYRIELDPKEGRIAEVLVHEVAHAWVSEGPTALVEGRAELLADCMVLTSPGLAPLQWDDGRELVSMPSLQSWRSHDDHGPSVNPMLRTDAYLGAARFVRLVGLIAPDGALWPQDDRFDWSDLDTLLMEAGQPGERLRAVLAADAETQRAALSDLDQDGLPLVGEQMFSTNPRRFDTDQDGWWDGAAVPTNALPLPFDGTPQCSGWATQPEGGVAVLEVGGNLRGTPAPLPVLRAGTEVFGRGRVAAVGQVSILVELDGDPQQVSGGLWARVDGEGLAPDDACFSTDSHVIWSAQAKLRPVVRAMHDALGRAEKRAAIQLGPRTTRLAVALGGPTSTVEGPVVHLSSRDVKKALATGQLDRLANQAVAMRQVWDTSTAVREWRDVMALARLLDAVEE